ncbi:hypothetical protein ASZ78_003009 [Callipepla squamata]|uniref:CIDE-N domain-containing protein n=1 Tax=Callipepla squamata TaxID=9009 RepID=A0A226NGT5_CALSU|nr:hypothetical protein ASZ78_003009 [Callipepla squamata]
MEVARDCVGSVLRSLVSMGSSMGAVTKQTLFPPLMPAGRPFRVSNASRSSRKGIVASSLQELISKIRNGVVSAREKKKMGVANITFDLYKLNPKDFIGCLNVKATFYEIYSVSYDIKCMGAKSILR